MVSLALEAIHSSTNTRNRAWRMVISNAVSCCAVGGFNARMAEVGSCRSATPTALVALESA